MFKSINDPISSISHLCGSVLAIPVTVVLVGLGVYLGSMWHIVAFLTFGLSLFALYTASTVYHLIPKTEPFKKAKLMARKIDHMMIYVLIAGTYTPICLISLRGVWGYTIVSLIWGIAFLGILFKGFVMSDSKTVRHISTGLYVVMGWLAVFAIYPITKNMSFLGVLFLILGGVSYSIGAVIYAFKIPKIKVEWLNFHDIFHFFVLLGSVFHILMMFTLF
ncbi:MAG: PAQR family membrane homeostasis protein TrhA [Lachnospirales bacterium]